MAYADMLDFSRSSSSLSVDTKRFHALDDNDFDDHFLDSATTMSPVSVNRRDSFATNHNGLFSPDFNDDFQHAFNDNSRPMNGNGQPTFYSNNPFMQMGASQAATYGQHTTAWPPLDEPSTSCTPTPTTAKGYDLFGHDQDAASIPFGSSAFGGLPVPDSVRPSSVFTQSQHEQTPMSPHDAQGWAQHAQEMDSRPMNKRPRQSSPDYAPFRSKDGIRKKNARFDIPAERSLNNIDTLIAEAGNQGNQDELAELKKQKRLLRNRQAALDSRQRKKKHTEELEAEKQGWTDQLVSLQDQLQRMTIEFNQVLRQNEELNSTNMQLSQHINTLQFEKEALVSEHTLESAELRKKVQFLAEELKAGPVAMSVTPSQSSFNDFTTDMDNLNMGHSDWDNWVNVDALPEDATPQPTHSVPEPTTTLVVATKKSESTLSDDDKPMASGLLLMLLLCGAFVASKSSGTSAPPLPRMPDDVRAASATVLDSIFKDAGVSPSHAVDPSTQAHNLLANRIEAFEPASSGMSWPAPKPTLSSVQINSNSHQASSFERLSHDLMSTTKDQEAEQLFSMTASQYNSLTSTDFNTRRIENSYDIESLSPDSQSSHGHRRNLAETLAAMREQSKGDTAADVYTRSLLWDKIPAEIVRDFKRMVEQSSKLDSAADDSSMQTKVECGAG